MFFNESTQVQISIKNGMFYVVDWVQKFLGDVKQQNAAQFLDLL